MKKGTKVVVNDNSPLHGSPGVVEQGGDSLLLIKLTPPVSLEYHMHGGTQTLLHETIYRLIDDLKEREGTRCP